MSARYFQDEESGETVFKVTKSQIRKTQKAAKFKAKEKQQQRQNKWNKRKKGSDPFPGKKPLDESALERHSRGVEGVNVDKIRTKFGKKKQERRGKAASDAAELAARTELLLDDECGFLEGDETDEFTANITQTHLKNHSDAEAAGKGFDLNLKQFGPYKVDYTRNGRHLLIGGRKGHVAAFEWVSKRLLCEINVQESVHDVKWLHTENLLAVAQKKWTYIYDKQGIEIHCLKKLDNVTHLEFLPYHFLLNSISTKGFLSWVDVSVGKMVAQFNTQLGSVSSMCQNPWNAVTCMSHAKGIVTMWTPNAKKNVAKMLAHRQAVTALAVDKSGTYLATTGADNTMKIWDVRQFKLLQDYKLGSPASHLAFSHRGLVGISTGNEVRVFKDCCTKSVEHPYMRHKVNRRIADLEFAPYEDALGIGHADGFTSIIVPGSGEVNFDALESNPYQTKNQRKEAEVKALLEKIDPELITLDPTKLGDVDLPTFEEKIAERNKKLFVKPSNVDFDPRNKTKGKGGTAYKFKTKKTFVEEQRRRNLKLALEESANESREGPKKKEKKAKTLIDRLK